MKAGKGVKYLLLLFFCLILTAPFFGNENLFDYWNELYDSSEGHQDFFQHRDFGLAFKLKSYPLNHQVSYGGQPCRLLKPLFYDKNEDQWIEIWHTAPLKQLNSFILKVQSDGYSPWQNPIPVTALLQERIQVRLLASESKITLIREELTGNNPKSVAFSPNGKWMAVANLGNHWIDLIPVDSNSGLKRRKLEIPEKYFPNGKKEKTSLVEICFLEQRKEMWVSQMSNQSIVHVFSTSDYTLKTSYPIFGNWSKVILADRDEKLIYIANWLTHDISVLRADTGKLVKKVAVSSGPNGKGIPRGLAFSVDEKILYSANFENGWIDKIRVSDLKLLKPLKIDSWGAKRHLVTDKKRNRLYVSDMAHAQISVIDLKTEKRIKTISVYHKPNTIALTPDGRFLMVSCRGKNNADWYTFEGADFGRIYFIDCEKMKVVHWIYGKNQPTGLAIHPTEQKAAFTNFLDKSLELLDYSGLYHQN